MKGPARCPRGATGLGLKTVQLRGNGSRPGVILSSGRHLAISGGLFGCHNLGRGALLQASSGERPGMPLKSPQATGSPAPNKESSSLNGNSAETEIVL